MGLIKTLTAGIWKVMPWWLKWYLACVTLPNITVIAGVCFLYLAPFVDGRIHAVIEPRSEMRDRQFIAVYKEMELRDKNIMDRLDRFDQHQSLMYRAQLDLASRMPAP